MEMSRCVFLCVFDTALIPMLRFNGDIELTVGLIVENSVRNFFSSAREKTVDSQWLWEMLCCMCNDPYREPDLF